MKNLIIIAVLIFSVKAFSQVINPNKQLHIQSVGDGVVFLHKQGLWNRSFYDTTIKRHYKLRYVESEITPINSKCGYRIFVVKYRNWKKVVYSEYIDYSVINLDKSIRKSVILFLNKANKKEIKEYKKELSWFYNRKQINKIIENSKVLYQAGVTDLECFF